MVKVYDISEDCDISSALPDALARLPRWRLQKALSFRQETDSFLCAKSFLILEDLLRERFSLDACPEFSYTDKGKPYLREYPDIFFSISHCRKGIAVAVSDRPVGIDIEETGYDRDVAAIVLNDEELAAVRHSEEPDVCFTEIWTRKESYLKLTGEGLRDDLKQVLPPEAGVVFKTEARRSSGYVVTLAALED